MPSGNPRKKRDMATLPKHSTKKAEDELLDSFSELIDEAAEKMSHEEFMKRAEKATETLDRAIAAHSRRRGTA
jgi:hypothetical protein